MTRTWVRHAVVAIALVVVAALLRQAPLGTSSLWLDDAWVALATRADTLADLRLVGLTAPGFALLLAGWSAVVGDTATAAQLLPFGFAVLAPAALYLVVRCHMSMPREADRDAPLARQPGGTPPLVAVAAGTFLAVAPAGIHFAARVKQYPLDALLAVGLLGIGWWVAERPASTRRWGWLTAGGFGAIAMTAAVVTVAAGAFAAAGLAAWRDGATARRRAAVATGAFAVLGGAWWWAVLRPAMTDPLRAYWADHYLQLDGGWLAAIGDVPRVLGDVLVAVSPLPVWASAVLVAVGVGWSAVRRPVVAALVAVPLLVGLALAALQLAPLGGGRTDHHLFPGLALGMAFALEPVWRRRRPVAVGAAAVLLVAVALTVPSPRPYPQEDLRPLVTLLDTELAAADRVVVYPSAVWAYALYTDLPVDVVDAPESVWRWQPDVLDPRVTVLEPHRDEPERYAPEVAAAVAGAPGAVWLVASHHREDIRTIEEALRTEGFAPVDHWRRPGARLTRWER